MPQQRRLWDKGKGASCRLQKVPHMPERLGRHGLEQRQTLKITQFRHWQGCFSSTDGETGGKGAGGCAPSRQTSSSDRGQLKDKSRLQSKEKVRELRQRKAKAEENLQEGSDVNYQLRELSKRFIISAVDTMKQHMGNTTSSLRRH